MQDLSKEDLEKAEGIGFPIVFIVLLLIFGSVAAALLPLSLGFIAVAITGAIVYFLSQAIQMSIFVTNISSMLGIGVAVDYSLFVLARYREEIKEGSSEDEARRVAMRTSGLAVAFSGVTVIIALAGLFLIDSKTAHSMAIGAIVVVGVAVLAAVTLLPALIATLGHRAYEPGKVIGKIVAKLTPKPKPEAVPFWTRWTNRLMNRPVLYATGATLLMLVIAWPAISMKLGTGAIAQLPPSFETAQGNALAARPPADGGGGPGAGGPVQIVVDYGGKPVDAAQVAEVRRGRGPASQRGRGWRRPARHLERRKPGADRGDVGEQPGGRRDVRPGAADPGPGRAGRGAFGRDPQRRRCRGAGP